MAPGGVEFDILSGYNPLPLEMTSACEERMRGADGKGVRIRSREPASGEADSQRRSELPATGVRP